MFGGRRPTFGFDVVPFVGLVFFPSPPLWELCYSLVLEGVELSERIFLSPASSLIPLLPSFLILLPFIFLFLMVFALTGCWPIVIF